MTKELVAWLILMLGVGCFATDQRLVSALLFIISILILLLPTRPLPPIEPILPPRRPRASIKPFLRIIVRNPPR